MVAVEKIYYGDNLRNKGDLAIIAVNGDNWLA
jgi:hypothetical protein